MPADDASNSEPATPSKVAAARPGVLSDRATPSPITEAADADAAAGAPEAVVPKPALGNAFLKGMVWSTLALIISKFSSLIATVCLAFVFRDRDYGAFASARGKAMFGDSLTDGGMRNVLISAGPAGYDRIARVAFRVSLGFNLAGCAVMTGTAAFVREGDVASQLVVSGLAMVLATFGSVQRARLATDLRFARAAFMYTISAILRNVLTVGFAFAGLGPLSFALPLVFVALWEACYVRRLIGPLPAIPADVRPRSLARELIGQGKWVIFAAFGGALVNRGDYLVASTYFHGPHDALALGRVDIAGQYMFAFQLTQALFTPLSLALTTVIQPVMARLKDDVDRHAEAFRKMVRISTLLTVPAAMVSIGVTPLLLHPIKGGYWDVTAASIQILAATEAIRQLYYMSTSTLTASGRFRTSAVVVILDGILTLLAAFIGCVVGGSLLSLTLAVGIQRTLTAILETLYVDRLAGGRPGRMLAEILPPLAVGGIVVVMLGLLVKVLAHDAASHRWMIAVAGVSSLPAYFLLCMLVVPRRTREARSLLLDRFLRRVGRA